MSKFSLLTKTTLRPQQEKAIEIFLKSDSKYLAIEMPTGQGKSITGMKMAEIMLNRMVRNG